MHAPVIVNCVCPLYLTSIFQIIILVIHKGKNNQAPGDFYPPVPPPERPVKQKMKHQGAGFLSYCRPGRRLGISNAKFHNFKPMHLSLKYNKLYLIPRLQYCAIFYLMKVTPGSFKLPVNREPLSKKGGSRFLTRYFFPWLSIFSVM